MNPDQIYVLLYSFSQHAFHVETLADTMRTGLRAIEKKQPNDFIVIRAAESRQAIDAFHVDLIERGQIPCP